MSATLIQKEHDPCYNLCQFKIRNLFSISVLSTEFNPVVSLFIIPLFSFVVHVVCSVARAGH